MARPPWEIAFLKNLEQHGIVSEACAAAGITRQAAYKRRRKFKKFRKRWKWAMQNANDLLEREARRRAVHGVDKPLTYKGKVYDTVKEFSDVLLIFLMKGRDPDRWRDRVSVKQSGRLKHEHAGDDTRPPFRVEIVEPPERPPDDGVDVTPLPDQPDDDA